jgi:hypothetical protein
MVTSGDFDGSNLPEHGKCRERGGKCIRSSRKICYTTRAVYEALQQLACTRCGADIPQGSTFIRAKMVGGGHGNRPQCPRCAPFQEPTPEELELYIAIRGRGTVRTMRRFSLNAREAETLMYST